MNEPKDKIEEIKELILTCGSLLMWGGFEVLCAFKPDYGATAAAQVTRNAIIAIVSSVFTFTFTRDRGKGEKK